MAYFIAKGISVWFLYYLFGLECLGILLKCSFKIFLGACSQITRVIAPMCNLFLDFWVIQPGNTLNVGGSWHDLTELGDFGPGRAASSRVSPNILACY